MNLALKIKKPFVYWQLTPAGPKQMPRVSVEVVDEDKFEENQLILQSKLDWNIYQLGFLKCADNVFNCNSGFSSIFRL